MFLDRVRDSGIKCVRKTDLAIVIASDAPDLACEMQEVVTLAKAAGTWREGGTSSKPGAPRRPPGHSIRGRCPLDLARSRSTTPVSKEYTNLGWPTPTQAHAM